MCLIQNINFMKAQNESGLERAFKVVEAIKEQALPVTKACEFVGLSRSEFYRELEDNEELRDTYTRAREIRADKIFEEILEIADSQGEDVGTNPETGEPQINHNVIQRNRLQIDARKWVLGKMSQRYADNQKIDVTTNGKDLPSNTIEVRVVPPTDSDDE